MREYALAIGLALAAHVVLAGEAPPPAGTDVTPSAPGEPVAAPVPPAAPPADATPAEPPPLLKMRSVFEYIEHVTVTGGVTHIDARSNVVVEVNTTEKGTVIDIRVVAGRKATKPDDPPPGKVTLLIGDEPLRKYNVAPLRVILKHSPTGRGNLMVTGVGDRLARDVVGVLTQAPTRTVLASDAVASYDIEIQSDGLPTSIRVEQRNAKLWVDWTLTGAGTFDVGKKGWELPVKFVVPEQDLGDRGVKLSAEVAMRYSSVRPGPERETTIEITIVLPGAGSEGADLVYTRKGELRPLAVELAEEPSAPKTVPGKRLLGDRAGNWARTATLATLGVQRLAGMMETGVAMWLCQVCMDVTAVKAMPDISDPVAARSLAGFGRSAPDLSAPSWLEAGMSTRGAKLRIEVGETFINFKANADGYSDSANSDVPDLSVALRWDWRNRWSLGAELTTLFARLNTSTPIEDWALVSLMGRAEYGAAKWTAGFSAGMSLVQYEADSPLRKTTGTNIFGYALSADGEWMIKKKIGLSLRADFIGGDGLQILKARAGFRWYVRPNVAFQTHYTFLDLKDTGVPGGTISADGTGLGIGVFIRY